MSEHEVREVQSSNAGASAVRPIFELTYRRVQNPHKAQLYVDFGVSQTGPWFLVGVNDTEYAFGYEPGRSSAQSKGLPNPHAR